MGNALVLTALGVTALLIAIDVGTSRGSVTKRNWSFLLLGVACIAAGFFLAPVIRVKEAAELMKGLLIALGATLVVLDFPDSEQETRSGLSLGPVAVLVGLFGPAIGESMQVVLGAVSGIAFGSIFLSATGRGRMAQDLAVAALLGTALNLSAAVSPGGQAVETTQTIITAALIAVFVGEGLKFALKATKSGWPRVGTAVIFGALAMLFCSTSLMDKDAGMVVGISVVLALVSGFAVKFEERFSTSAILLCTMSWLGLATVAFGTHKGYGVALAGLTGFVTLLLTGNRRLLPILAPLAAFVGYRLVRSVYGDVTSSFEISQHYAVLGLIAGIGAPLLAFEAGAVGSLYRGWRSLATPVLVGIATLVAVSGLAMFLGDQGGVGLVIGAGVSPVVALLARSRSQSWLALASGLMAWTAGTIGTLLSSDPIEREGKAWVVGSVATIVLIAAVLVWALNRQTKEVPA